MNAIELNRRTIRGRRANVVSGKSPVSSLLGRPVVTIAPEATLAAAVESMEAAGVSALLVDRLGGIITERDIARALGHGVAVDEPVDGIATPHPLVVPGSTTVVAACALMLNEQVRHLIVDHDGTFGMISLRDVAAALLQSSDPQIWLTSLRLAIETPPETWLG